MSLPAGMTPAPTIVGSFVRRLRFWECWGMYFVLHDDFLMFVCDVYVFRRPTALTNPKWNHLDLLGRLVRLETTWQRSAILVDVC